MNCLDLATLNFEEPTPCQKEEIMKQKGLFTEMMEKTRNCLSNIGDDPDRVQCETAYLSQQNEFTFHTHPDGTRFPSDVDKKTTKRLNKDRLCIGLVPSNEVVCWNKRDNFKKEEFSF